MSSDSVKFQLFLVGVHCQFVALSVWYASNAHQRLLLFKVSHDHINCKKVDGVCSLDSLKICCMGCSTETDAWGASSWKRGHAGSWIPNSELLVNLTRNYSGFMFNLSIWSGTCVAWIQNQKPTFPPLWAAQVLLPRLEKRGVDVADLIALSRSVWENETMLWMDRAVATLFRKKIKVVFVG